jgi:MFS family permease
VPDPEHSSVHRDAEPVLSQLGAVLRNPQLLRLDYGMFTLHLLMTSLFLVVPLFLIEHGLAAGRHWLLYLPVLVLSVGAMIPFIVQAESRGRTKTVMLGSVLALSFALLGLYGWGQGVVAIAVLLFVFFTAVNVLEAVLPSLVAKIAPAEAKGTAMGVFSSSQFAGAFLGGLAGGLVHQQWGPSGVLLFGAAAALAWLLVALPMVSPRQVTNQVIRLSGETPGADLQDRLLQVQGVEEAVVVAEEGRAYLKVDNRRLDWARLQAFSAGD